MSSMLEQAIVDAQALREAALKNAEQALIEKFTPQIKEAVESLLEGDMAQAKKKVSYEGKNYSLQEIEDGKATIMREGEKAFVVAESELGEELDEDLLQEEEVDGLGSPEEAEEEIMAPFAALDDAEEGAEDVVYDIEFDDPEFQKELDFGKIDADMDKEPQESYDDVAADMSMGDEAGGEGDDLLADLGDEETGEEDLVQEIMKLMNEMDEDDEELLEEELTVDVSEQKHGHIVTDEAARKYDEELRKAQLESDEMKEELEEEKKKNEDLQEALKHFKHKNKQYKDVVEKLSQKLNETLLSNAKLLYSNKTLSDASLNERQKTKIVEAIAKSRTPEEAKHLCETLNATVTSSRDNKSPRTLSESVNRKSNLSGILSTRKQQVNESVEHTFADKMKKLAGIK